MQCLLAVTAHRPLTVHASLYVPGDDPGPRLVPRLLGPLGAFFTLTVTDPSGASLYESMPVKVKLKLDPRLPGSYVTLDPGNSLGTVLSVPKKELSLKAGDYRLSVSYDSGAFTGPEESPFGRIEARTEVTMHVSAGK